VTHELRTPLTLIIGPVENIIKDDSDREKNRYYARTIRQNAGKLLNLVEELLDLSRMEANKLVVDNKPVQLYRFLSRIKASFTPYAEHRNIQIMLDYQCSDELTILMDARKWEKIINNLLSNALKFTPGGGLITLSAGLSDENIIITVEDTGEGIHPDDLPHVFDRYFQSKTLETSLQGGTGIGLSLCREYIRLFDGEISVQSTVGKGSKFTLIFTPGIVARESLFPELALISESDADEQMQQTRRSGNYTILLVEDDRDMSGYIQQLLEPEYRVLVADNGKKGLQLLEKNQVDLVLSDVMMPEMDGFQFLKTARELYTGLPFIMLTARADAPDRLNALRLGVDDYLTKPFMEEELMARLGNLLRRSDIRKSVIASYEIPDEDLSFDQKWLSRLENLVLENIRDSEFSLDSLAEGLNMSRKTLYNKVTAYTGMTPNQYITEIRLNKARQILESRSFETISEVCYAVGMKTPYYFGKLMKDRFGKAPSEFM
jgi:DNA-binding response OmpR family regulator/anti-sigma regulatory factor (Ser/Thr protein kinase)